ncbi:uncharacterized protein ARB_04657 [Trichophyton benhamiae CBS 112371]|uniref:Uncharacterized protein n=1 Tax=Arthroderma benhamiae (strain ATCC MYA-4681 / CBS 112371) TaxID=663331 RepID=D4AK56_ARTBC|nr:uncharacterized protein ARB_04657 [Trichophyton benhamiae CBS 112371]EFE37129.1 conserved hypothetical protein [Trichophyton benhamiae CBS 112371]
MATEDNAVSGLTMADRVQKIRSRLSALFAGGSPPGSCGVENSYKPSRLSAAEIRMYDPGSGGSVRGERNLSSGRRSISSTGSVIDNNAPPNDNILPFSPPSTESGGHMTSSRAQQRVENHIHRGGVLLNWIQRSVEAHPHQPKHKPSRSKLAGWLLCMRPRAKARSTRRKLIDCAISGIFLASVLTTCLSPSSPCFLCSIHILTICLDLVLAVTSSGKKFEFHIILIIALMACTVYFCHSLIRLLMTAKRRQVRRRRVHYNQPTRDPDMVESFTHIDRPIPVIFATDLEMGLGTEAEEGENKPGQISIPPPAYGLWRGSVKMDPSRLYWQRIDPQKPNRCHSQSMGEPRPPSTNRPPSYISDEGQPSTVVNLQPQLQGTSTSSTTAPTEQ